MSSKSKVTIISSMGKCKKGAYSAKNKQQSLKGKFHVKRKGPKSTSSNMNNPYGAKAKHFSFIEALTNPRNIPNSPSRPMLFKGFLK